MTSLSFYQKKAFNISRTLIFSISALDLLVYALLNLPLEDPRAGGLVEASDL